MLTDAMETTGVPAAELLAPIAPGLHATLAELVFAVTHEGAATVEDLLALLRALTDRAFGGE